MPLSFSQTIQAHNEAVSSLLLIENQIYQAVEAMIDRVRKGGRVYWMGNGGSAADAQHYAAELMVRYEKNRDPIASVALTTDSSLLTAHSNDFEYETVFLRQVQALVTPADVVVGISTSGNSSNVDMAMKRGTDIGALTIGMLGKDGGCIKQSVNIPLIVKSEITAHIQEAHLVMGHYICSSIERACC
jgi:D-sedoheptulose 7-phosphate isomerase